MPHLLLQWNQILRNFPKTPIFGIERYNEKVSSFFLYMLLTLSHIDSNIASVEAMIGYGIRALAPTNIGSQVTWRDSSKSFAINVRPSLIDINGKLWDEILLYLPKVTDYTVNGATITKDYPWRFYTHIESQLITNAAAAAFPEGFKSANLSH